jgi:hypothetical protein
VEALDSVVTAPTRLLTFKPANRHPVRFTDTIPGTMVNGLCTVDYSSRRSADVRFRARDAW